MGYTIRFEGGQIGGTTEFHHGYPRSHGDIHVPIMARISLTESAMPYPVPMYQQDTYRFEGEIRDTDEGRDERTYIYRWVRPNVEGMQAQIYELKKQVEKLKHAEEALDALKTLQTYLNNGF